MTGQSDNLSAAEKLYPDRFPSVGAMQAASTTANGAVIPSHASKPSSGKKKSKTFRPGAIPADAFPFNQPSSLDHSNVSKSVTAPTSSELDRMSQGNDLHRSAETLDTRAISRNISQENDTRRSSPSLIGPTNSPVEPQQDEVETEKKRKSGNIEADKQNSSGRTATQQARESEKRSEDISAGKKRRKSGQDHDEASGEEETELSVINVPRLTRVNDDVAAQPQPQRHTPRRTLPKKMKPGDLRWTAEPNGSVSTSSEEIRQRF